MEHKTAERLEPEVDQSLNGQDGSLVGRSPTVEEIAQRAYEIYLQRAISAMNLTIVFKQSASYETKCPTVSSGSMR